MNATLAVDRVRRLAFDSPLLSAVLRQWHDVALPDCWLVAGALAQTVWNHAFGLSPAHGIADIDIVYFDAADLSEETEAAQSARIRQLFANLPVWIDVKNEARVHLWYAAKFGHGIAPYTSTADAISTFPTTSTAIGLQPTAKHVEVYAPYGLEDLLGLIVRPNKKQITRPIYEAKVARWLSLWPKLRIIPWDAEA
jgi:hypothetical protein